MEYQNLKKLKEKYDKGINITSYIKELGSDTYKEEMKDVKYKVHEGTYLAWLDCKAVAKKLGDPEGDDRVGDMLKKFFIQKAGVNINPGENYGRTGVGYMRMNLGTTHRKLHGALNSMKAAIDAI